MYKYMEEKLSSLKVQKDILKMDAPNAPNPANPNAQRNPDQNQDQGQDQDQVPAGQVPPPVPAQPVLQPAPAGVVPVPQIVYQNWIGKKPEFSGKPEEDAESIFLVQEIGWKHIISQKEKR